MNPTDRDRLMNEVLDGVASPEEQAALREHLERDPESRARFEDLERVFHVLAAVPMEAAPPELRTGVARAISGGLDAAPPRLSVPAWRVGVVAFLRRRPAAGAVLSFAVGAAAAAMLVLVFVQTPVGPLPVSGTMGNAPQRLGTPLESRDVQLGSTHFSLRSHGRGQELTMDLSVRGSEPSEVVLEFDPQKVEARELRWSSSAEVQVSPGRVTMGAAASREFTIAFHGNGRDRAEIQVGLQAGDHSAREVFQVIPSTGVQ